MNNDRFTQSRISGLQQVLRDVTAPSSLHILARPLPSSTAVDDHTAASMGAKSADTIDRSGGELLAAVERAAYEQGIVQGRTAVLDAELALQRQAGYAEGMQAGLEEGRKSGEQAIRQAAAERLLRLDDLLQALPAQLDAKLKDAEEDMLALSMDVLHRFLGENVARADTIMAMLKVAIREHRARREVSVHLHPHDCQTLKNDENFCAWLASRDEPVQWTLIADEDVRLGGVMLSSVEGTLDARLESQLQALHSALLQQRVERAAVSDAGRKVNRI